MQLTTQPLRCNMSAVHGSTWKSSLRARGPSTAGCSSYQSFLLALVCTYFPTNDLCCCTTFLRNTSWGPCENKPLWPTASWHGEPWHVCQLRTYSFQVRLSLDCIIAVSAGNWGLGKDYMVNILPKISGLSLVTIIHAGNDW